MGKPSHRLRRQQLNRLKIERRKASQELHRRQAAQGLTAPRTVSLSNGKCEWATVDEEREARQQAVEEEIHVFRSVLPTLLSRLARIPDPVSYTHLTLPTILRV